MVSSLKAKSSCFSIDMEDWKIISHVYRYGEASLQTYMLSVLSPIINLDIKQLQDILIPMKEGQIDLDASFVKINQILLQKLQVFQSKILSIVPRLETHSLEIHQWERLFNLLNKERSRRLTPLFVLSALATIKAISYDELVVSLSRKPNARAAKRGFDLTADVSLPRIKRNRLDVSEKNPAIVMASSRMSESLQHELTETGTRVITPSEPVTPQKGFSVVHETPGGTKIRPIFVNNVGSIFLPLSPQATPSRSKGMVEIDGITNEKIQSALPQLSFIKPPTSIEFVATLPKIIARQQFKRRASQNVLMKASCRDVFQAHGIDTVITSRGSQYHWSHLIAYFLGGAQARENIVAGTAASNYNTLELVEQFIAEKLTKDRVPSIHIQVSPNFSHALLIPNELVFDLAWEDADQQFKETIRINPRSYRREAKSMLATVGLFREAARPFSMRQDPSLANDLLL